MVVLRLRDLDITRPVRLLHPRHPLYIVPRGQGLYMLGATQIESEGRGHVARLHHPGLVAGLLRRSLNRANGRVNLVLGRLFCGFLGWLFRWFFGGLPRRLFCRLFRRLFRWLFRRLL